VIVRDKGDSFGVHLNRSWARLEASFRSRRSRSSGDSFAAVSAALGWLSSSAWGQILRISLGRNLRASQIKVCNWFINNKYICIFNGFLMKKFDSLSFGRNHEYPECWWQQYDREQRCKILQPYKYQERLKYFSL
jgi:hypothetical protein